jgi:hypothetical protein
MHTLVKSVFLYNLSESKLLAFGLAGLALASFFLIGHASSKEERFYARIIHAEGEAVIVLPSGEKRVPQAGLLIGSGGGIETKQDGNIYVMIAPGVASVVRDGGMLQIEKLSLVKWRETVLKRTVRLKARRQGGELDFMFENPDLATDFILNFEGKLLTVNHETSWSVTSNSLKVLKGQVQLNGKDSITVPHGHEFKLSQENRAVNKLALTELRELTTMNQEMHLYFQSFGEPSEIQPQRLLIKIHSQEQ